MVDMQAATGAQSLWKQLHKFVRLLPAGAAGSYATLLGILAASAQASISPAREWLEFNYSLIQQVAQNHYLIIWGIILLATWLSVLFATDRLSQGRRIFPNWSFPVPKKTTQFSAVKNQYTGPLRSRAPQILQPSNASTPFKQMIDNGIFRSSVIDGDKVSIDDVLIRVCKKLGYPVSRKRNKLWHRDNAFQELRKKCIANNFSVFAVSNEYKHKLLTEESWSHGYFDGQSKTLTVRWTNGSTTIYRDLLFLRKEIDTLWPDLIKP